MLKGNCRNKNLTNCERKMSSYKPAFKHVFLSFIDHNFEERRKILKAKHREGSTINIKLI